MDFKSVLVVDDSTLARMMLRNVITGSFPNWTIVEAKTAREALEILANQSVHLALIDFNMPEMNGLELSIQLMENYPNLPIHLVTANIQEKMQLKAEAMGIGFIMKPVSKEKLAPVLSSL